MTSNLWTVQPLHCACHSLFFYPPSPFLTPEFFMLLQLHSLPHTLHYRKRMIKNVDCNDSLIPRSLLSYYDPPSPNTPRYSLRQLSLHTTMERLKIKSKKFWLKKKIQFNTQEIGFLTFHLISCNISLSLPLQALRIVTLSANRGSMSLSH